MFYEFSTLLLIAAFVGAVAVLLRQPLIVAFIAVGVIVGPAWLGLSAHRETELLATVGISLLLFVVGLRLDLHIIRSLGSVALATGLGQVFFTSVIGYLIRIGLGMAPVPALYVAVAVGSNSRSELT